MSQPVSVPWNGRHQPPSQALAQGCPDPADFSVIDCPYCIDAREMGVGLAGCLRHARTVLP